MLGQLSGQEETDRGLNLARGDGGPLVVVSQAASLGGDALEEIVDEGVHDGHGLGGHSGVGVHLLQHLVDCLLYTSPSPRDKRQSRMPSSA